MHAKSKMKILLGSMLLGAGVAASMPAAATSETMQNLLSILRDRGSISQDEYNALMNAAAMEDQEAKKKEEKMAEAAKSSKSDWTDKVRIKGDLRTRYENNNTDGKEDRGRGRIRYRVGVIAQPTDGWEVGAGFASGGDDPRSTNQTFTDAFSTKGLQLDYAYMQYQFTDSIKAVAGKFQFKDYLWNASDVIWDGDVNPEGFSANFTTNTDFGKFFANTGIWVLQEVGSSSHDPYMVYGQGGLKFGQGDWFGTAAVSVYSFEDITSLTSTTGFTTYGGHTNTVYNFGDVQFSGEIGTKFPGGGKGSIFGDYVNNYDTNDPRDDGFSLGAKYGIGDWKFKYIYAQLGRNAWPDFLPDSDRFGGDTGIDSHEFIAEYEVMKHVTLGADYYHSTKNAGNIDQDLVQLDVVVKF